MALSYWGVRLWNGQGEAVRMGTGGGRKIVARRLASPLDRGLPAHRKAEARGCWSAAEALTQRCGTRMREASSAVCQMKCHVSWLDVDGIPAFRTQHFEIYIPIYIYICLPTCSDMTHNTSATRRSASVLPPAPLGLGA